MTLQLQTRHIALHLLGSKEELSVKVEKGTTFDRVLSELEQTSASVSVKRWRVGLRSLN